MKKLICLVLLSSCSIPHPVCAKKSKVVKLGQCSYSKVGDFGSSRCVALTDDGNKITGDHPFVEGEELCVKYEWKK